ncbi:hypothetical protein PSY81_23520, partial [Shigella flexneri]|nr:hypothetical protein [Shigella flexneri]
GNDKSRRRSDPLLRIRAIWEKTGKTINEGISPPIKSEEGLYGMYGTIRCEQYEKCKDLFDELSDMIMIGEEARRSGVRSSTAEICFP